MGVALTTAFVLVTVYPAISVSSQVFPNDPGFKEQWGLHNTGQFVVDRSGTPDADVDAPEAWTITTGGPEVVVAVIDEGVNYDHPDLASNMWSNPGGVNGCAKGTHGYDFLLGRCDPKPDRSHGTRVAGVLGAAGGNGAYGAGTAWITRIMALKIDLKLTGNALSSMTTEAVNWVVAAKQAGVNVRVINYSYGGEGSSGGVFEAIKRAGDNGILFVTASGNHSRDVDKQPVYPCAHDLPNLICTGGTDQNDNPIFNWGAQSVHIAAPALNIYSTCYSDIECHGNGTSNSAPFVSGAAALIWSKYPDLTVAEVRSKILHNVDKLASLEGKNATSGRLNLHRALTGPIPPPPSTLPATGGSSSSNSSGGSSSSSSSPSSLSGGSSHNSQKGSGPSSLSSSQPLFSSSSAPASFSSGIGKAVSGVPSLLGGEVSQDEGTGDLNGQPSFYASERSGEPSSQGDIPIAVWAALAGILLALVRGKKLGKSLKVADAEVGSEEDREATAEGLY